jgi:hypothetical protein
LQALEEPWKVDRRYVAASVFRALVLVFAPAWSFRYMRSSQASRTRMINDALHARAVTGMVRAPATLLFLQGRK